MQARCHWLKRGGHLLLTFWYRSDELRVLLGGGDFSSRDDGGLLPTMNVIRRLAEDSPLAETVDEVARESMGGSLRAGSSLAQDRAEVAVVVVEVWGDGVHTIRGASDGLGSVREAVLEDEETGRAGEPVHAGLGIEQ